MKYGLALLALVSVLSTDPLNSKPLTSPTDVVDQNAALRLLDASYAASSKIEPTQRVYYLTYLTIIAADIESKASDSESTALDTHRTRAWCNELFSLAFQMPLGPDRIATEKNALMQLSRVDAPLALSTLPQVEFPQPDAMGEFPEDVRADGAITIFQNLWEASKKSGVPVSSRLKQINSVAKHIEDTGEYPYRAMARIIQELANTPDDNARIEASSILEEAVQSYQRKEEFKFQNRRDEFLVLLQNVKPLVSIELYKQALHVFVGQITTGKPQQGKYEAKAITKKTEVSFSDSNRAFLFRVSPLINQVDHQWNQELVRDYPELAQADDEIVSFRAHKTSGIATAEERAQARQKKALEGEIQKIKELQKTDLPQAFARAQALPNPTIRINCLMALLDDGAQSATSTPQIQSIKVLPELAATIFKQGVTMFDQAPNERANRRSGFNELARVTELYASCREGWLLERIQNLQNDTLKAYLLMYAAKGMAEPRKIFSLPPPT